MDNVSPTLKCTSIVEYRKKNNLPVFNFGLGQNPLPVPKFVQKSLANHSSNKNYTSVSGIPEVEKTLLHHYKNDTFTPKNVILGNGLKELLFLLQLSFEGKIFHITPSWVSYKEQVKILKKEHDLIEIETNLENQYKIDFKYLESKLKKYENEPKMVIFNNPNNPLGIQQSSEYTKYLAYILNKYNCIVMSDEIYSNLGHTRETTSISNFCSNNCIVGSSLSKDLGCGGYRIGWLVFPESLKNLYTRCKSYASSIYSCVSTPLQYVVCDVYNNLHVLVNQYELMNTLCREYVKQAHIILKHTKLTYVLPNSSWYIFINFENYFHKLKLMDIYTSEDLNLFLLKEFGIVTVAAKYFNSNELSLRFSLVDIDLDYVKEGMNKLDIVNSFRKMREGLIILRQFVRSL